LDSIVGSVTRIVVTLCHSYIEGGSTDG
jgi:hypothetical protein